MNYKENVNLTQNKNGQFIKKIHKQEYIASGSLGCSIKT